MADGDKKETYTFDEHTAILADRVARETSEITADRDQLKTQLDEAQKALDAADSAKVAAEQAKETAETALTEYKGEVEEREAAASRQTERVDKIKDEAKHLPDEWFTEERVARIVAMKEEDFPSYVTDLVAGAPAGGEGTREVPRETAMQGKKVGGEKPSAARAFMLRDYETQEV